MRQKIILKMKEQDETSEGLNEMKLNNLPDKELKVMVIQIHTGMREVNELRENFNQEKI